MFRKRYVNILEYTSDSASRKYVKLCPVNNSTYPNKLFFSQTRLAIALARTTFTISPGNIELVLQAASSYLNLLAIASPITRYFSLKSRFRSLYRDFSRSSRVGGIAEAISYLFAQDILGYPIVVDYNEFLESQEFPPVSGLSPDFVISNTIPRHVSLLEAKGMNPQTVTSGVKSEMREGMNQCNSGKVILVNHGLPVINTYVSAVSFAADNDNWETTLHFADPEDNIKGELSSPTNLLKYHYASWFMLLGYYEQAIQMVTSDKFNMIAYSTGIDHSFR